MCDHRGADVGQVVALERTEDDSIVAIAVVHGLDWLLAPSHPVAHWSPSLRYATAAAT